MARDSREPVTVTVTQEHYRRAVETICARASVNLPVVIALCCPVFQALREAMPNITLLVGMRDVTIGDRQYYSPDTTASLITYSFTETEWAPPLPLPARVTFYPRR